ncbi:Protein melted [Eumeta japonica]|uniref:Protein melted n=1 Tax=Eumeta variegata TaxID=151549 RepID=A0A4C1XVG9_EUMVA|nr:Protein melted [Eumeta japonica]
MHELFKQVLNERDLSRAGDLFSIPDSEIVNDLTDVIKKITEISSQPEYCQNDNDQSVVEICVTRVTSCVRDTGTVEAHCGALVALLETCLHHNLRPAGHHRDDDPPHAKIASDVISCIFLASDNQNYIKKGVMEAVLPVAVKFLHKGNKELSRHMARYLSLAAIHHARLLQSHVQPIMDSIISGNYPLCRVLSQLYEVCPEPLGGHAMALVSLLPLAEQPEKLALLSLFELIAGNDPSNVSANVQAVCCVCVLKVLLALSKRKPALLLEHCSTLRRAARPPHATAQQVTLVAQERAQEALNFVLEQLPRAERSAHTALLREATALCSAYPALFTDRVLAAVRARNSEVNQTSGGVTIVKLSGSTVHSPPVSAAPAAPAPLPAVAPQGGYTRRAKLGDSRSTGRLHTGGNTHRSMTRLNVAGGSVGGLHKSMTRLSSSQQINQNNSAAAANKAVPACGTAGAAGGVKCAGGGVTVTAARARHHHHNIFIGSPTNNNNSVVPTLISNPPVLPSQSLTLGKSSDVLTTPPITSSVSIQHSSTALGHVSVINSSHNTSTGPTILTQTLGSGPITVGSNPPISISGPVTVTSRRANNTSVTMINSNANHRISVFEPYPMRDTVQHFCEKHLDKIKAYMDNVSLRLPPPAKCTIEGK